MPSESQSSCANDRSFFYVAPLDFDAPFPEAAHPEVGIEIFNDILVSRGGEHAGAGAAHELSQVEGDDLGQRPIERRSELVGHDPRRTRSQSKREAKPIALTFAQLGGRSQQQSRFGEPATRERGEARGQLTDFRCANVVTHICTIEQDVHIVRRTGQLDSCRTRTGHDRGLILRLHAERQHPQRQRAV